MRLLLVEDEAALRIPLAAELAAAGYAVDGTGSGIDAAHLGATEPYDAIVLDLGLPDRPGLDVLADWRRQGIATPVLVLTARDAWHERVAGLRAGADDYVGKPFHVEEVLARLAALIRRAQALPPGRLTAGSRGRARCPIFAPKHAIIETVGITKALPGVGLQPRSRE